MALSVEVTFDSKEVQTLLRQIIKRVNDIDKRSKSYTDSLSKVVLEDIKDHFDRQQGPEGKWAPWSVQYRKLMQRRGKATNLVLQDSGRLKAGFTKDRIQVSKAGIIWFNPVRYANVHNEGGRRLPRRPFAWLRDKAVSKIADETIKFIGV